MHFRIRLERADIFRLGQFHRLSGLFFGQKIIVEHRFFRCLDPLPRAVADHRFVDEDREQFVERVAVAARVAPQVENHVSQPLFLEIDDRLAHNAYQPAVVGEKRRDRYVARSGVGIGAYVGVGLFGLVQGEDGFSGRLSRRLHRQHFAVAFQVDAEPPDGLAVEIAVHQRGRYRVTVVVAVFQIVGRRHSVDRRHTVAAPELRVERAVDNERVVDLQQREGRHPQFAAQPALVALFCVDFGVAVRYRSDPVVRVFVVQPVVIGAHDPEQVGGQQRILAQRIAAGVDLGQYFGFFGGGEQRIEPRMARDAVEIPFQTHTRAGQFVVQHGEAAAGNGHRAAFRSVGFFGPGAEGACRKQQRKEDDSHGVSGFCSFC